MRNLSKKLQSLPWIDIFFFSILVFWIFGIHVADMSRVFAGVAILGIFMGRNWTSQEFQLRGKKLGLLCIFVGFYLFLLPMYQISKVYAGTQGIDFAIFSQVIDSISRYGWPASSLISSDWVNFLGHHFVPFLYVPGFFSFLGLPAYISGVLIHSLGVAVMAAALYRLARALGFSKSMGVFFVALILANPSIRHTVFWGIHDETFALPFIALAFLQWHLGKHWICALVLFGAALCKESMFLFNICFSLMVFLLGYKSLKSKEEWEKRFFPYALVALLSTLSFVAYFFMQPMLIGKSFDHFSKLGSLDYLFSFSVLKDKLLWLSFLFVPVLFLPLFQLRSILYLLPAAPFVGIVFASGFEDMHKLLNYYAAVPSLIISIASIYAIKERSMYKLNFIPKGMALLGISLAFSFASSKPSKDLWNNINMEQRSEKQLQRIPKNAKLIATSASSLFVCHCNKVQQLTLANTNASDFDYIVTRADEEHLIHSSLKDKTHLCAESSLWKIYCHRSLETSSLL